jgi:hypothetical protein
MKYVTVDKTSNMEEVPRQRKSCDWLTLDKARVWLELLVGGDGRRRGFDVAHPRVRRAGRVGPYTRGNARTICIVNSPVIGMKIRENFNVQIHQMQWSHGGSVETLFFLEECSKVFTLREFTETVSLKLALYCSL